MFFAGEDMGLIQLLKIFMLKFSMEQVSNMASANVGFKLYGEHNLNFSDNIDYIKEACEMIIIIVLDWYNLLL
jgi:hypothetical protein